MSGELDPKEVLMHLHDLGYYNITPGQLNEFIKDLKKLIQYDMAKKKKRIMQPNCTDDSASSPLPNTTDESVSSSPIPTQPPTHHTERSCSCNCDYKCPCKLREKVFPTNPKNMTSKILPKGPFHIQGRVIGPLGHQRDGNFEISGLQLRGVFEFGSETSKDDKAPENSSQGSEQCKQNRQERGVWFSKEDIDKAKRNKEECNSNKNTETSYSITEEDNHKRKHDKSTCKYCGLIHHILSSSEGLDRNDRLAKKVQIKRVISDSQVIVDFRRKGHNVNETDTSKNLLKNNYNNKQFETQRGGYIQMPEKKGQSATSSFGQQQLRDVNDVCKGISSPGKEGREYWHQRFLGAKMDTVTVTSLDSSLPREQRPRQFTVQADVHRQDESTVLSSDTTGPSSTQKHSTPISWKRPPRPPEISTSPILENRDNRPMLNLAMANKPAQQNAQTKSDSYFETRIPVTLKGFQGEVKTEVEVHKRQRHEESKNPLVTVATNVKIHKI